MTWLSIIDFIVRQVFSGRWILTVAASLILWHEAMVNPDKSDKIIDLCKDIVLFYFVVKQALDAPPKNTQVIETKTTTDIKPEGASNEIKSNPIDVGSINPTPAS